MIRFRTEETGSTMAEFSLMSSLIAVACIVSGSFLGNSSASSIESTANAMSPGVEIENSSPQAYSSQQYSDSSNDNSLTNGENNSDSVPDTGSFQACPIDICGGGEDEYQD